MVAPRQTTVTGTVFCPIKLLIWNHGGTVPRWGEMIIKGKWTPAVQGRTVEEAKVQPIPRPWELSPMAFKAVLPPEG